MDELIRVHCRHCGQTYLTPDASLGQCDLCRKPGGLVFGEGADKAARRQERELRQPKGEYPVSQVCPECGGTEFKTVQPDRWIAFSRDRVCKSCGTRYIPPTPWWAGLV